MTTASWNTVVDQSSDAAFRVWGLELSGKFGAVGMVNTTDTGQINWATVTRAGTNAAAGYEIWKLSGGALYFKIEYGSGNANTVPSFWLTVGTGSNGSGTLTGQLSTRTQCGTYNSALTSTVTNYQSYLCATADYFGLAWKLGSYGTASRARLFMTVMRTVDTTGAATSTGYFAYVCTSASNTGQSQCVATTAAVTGTALTAVTFTFIPNQNSSGPASSTDGSGNNQAFLWWYNILGTAPIQPLLHAALILLSDLAVGSTASMTLVGTSAHTYLSASISVQSDGLAFVTNTNLALAMLWE